MRTESAGRSIAVSGARKRARWPGRSVGLGYSTQIELEEQPQRQVRSWLLLFLFLEGTWEIGHTRKSSAASKTWPCSRNWVLAKSSIGGDCQRACRSWLTKRPTTATPLPCENWLREGTSSSASMTPEESTTQPGL